MGTIFDIVTVTCFAVLVLTFFMWTDREPRTLMHFMVPAASFAVANQVGNANFPLLAAVLISAGIGYTVIVLRGL